MENGYAEEIARMHQGVGDLKQAVSKFLNECVNPVFKDTDDWPEGLDLEINSLVQKTNNLASSFDPVAEKLENVDASKVDFYSLAGVANNLESAVKAWQAKFRDLKNAWLAIHDALNEREEESDTSEENESLDSLLGQCEAVEKSLQNIYLKSSIYEKLQPSIVSVVEEVGELKKRLQNLVKDWLPRPEDLQQQIEPLVEGVGHLNKSTNPGNGFGEQFSEVLEKHRNFRELIARWQLCKDVESALRTALSHLDNLENCFQKTLSRWRPPDEEVSTLYNSILTRYRELGNQSTEKISQVKQYENLRVGFDQFEAAWNSSVQEVLDTLERWVNRY